MPNNLKINALVGALQAVSENNEDAGYLGELAKEVEKLSSSLDRCRWDSQQTRQRLEHAEARTRELDEMLDEAKPIIAEMLELDAKTDGVAINPFAEAARMWIQKWTECRS